MFPGPDDPEVRCPTHLLLESFLRACVTTAGLSWDKTSLHPTAA
jgi:hypothetical protein